MEIRKVKSGKFYSSDHEDDLENIEAVVKTQIGLKGSLKKGSSKKAINALNNLKDYLSES